MKKNEKIQALVVTFFFLVSTFLSPQGGVPQSQAQINEYLVIAGFQAENLDTQNVRSTMILGLSEVSGVQVVDDPGIQEKIRNAAVSDTQAQAQKKVEQGYQYFEQGKEFYQNLDLNKAVQALNLSVKSYREGIASLRDNHYLLFSHLYLGMNLIFAGREKDGKKLIHEMVMLDSERKTRELPIREFPPKIIEIHKSITKEVLERPSGKLLVQSQPDGAVVVVDGVEMGKTPIEVPDLPRGMHFLVVEKTGYKTISEPVLVKGGEFNYSQVLQKQTTFDVIPKDQSTNQDLEPLKRLAADIGVDHILLGSVDSEQSKISAQVFHAQTSSFSNVFTQGYQKDKMERSTKKLVSKIEAWIRDQRKTSRFENTPQTTITEGFQESMIPKASSTSRANSFEDGNKPFYKKWWFWAIIGGAAAVGAGAALIGGSDASSNVLSIDNPLN
ncbi:MAG: PEGA domain-containing protein [Bdellovibrionota bacterium]